MKNSWVHLVFPLCFYLASAQSLTEPTYLLRAETIVSDPANGGSNVCVIVLPDGHYRLEKYHSTRGTGGAWVYSDMLPEESMKQLRTVLLDPKFQAIHTGPIVIPENTYKTLGGFVTGNLESMDMLSVIVPREHEVQKFAFKNSEERRPYQKDLKPFQRWLKELEKRKLVEDKKESRTNCSVPHAVDRTSAGPR